MVWLAPRALEDGVRPRRLAGVVGRPINFTVRCGALTSSRGWLRFWAVLS